MIIGVPKEIKNHEYRVGLTPETVKKLAETHVVRVERGAGNGSGFTNNEYEKAGALLTGDASTVYFRSDMIIKVKEPVLYEPGLLQFGQIVFCFFHFPANLELRRVVVQTAIRAVPYENIQLPDGSCPILAAMSKVAAEVAVDAAAHYLRKENGGKGKLLKDAKAFVIGCQGELGRRALELLSERGAYVVGYDRPEKIKACYNSYDHVYMLKREFHGLSADTPPSFLENVDLIICAAANRGRGAPKLITREMVRRMEPGSVIVDPSIDEGGCSETSRPTTYDSPVYVEEGTIHYCVTNMPGVVPRSSTPALVGKTLPYITEVAEKGWEAALAKNKILAQAVDSYFLGP